MEGSPASTSESVSGLVRRLTRAFARKGSSAGPEAPRARGGYALEPIEPRVLLSADAGVALASAGAAEVMDDPLQVFYIDIDGATDVDYHGPVELLGIDVPAFALPEHLAGQEAQVLQSLIASLNAMDFGPNVLFTTEMPDEEGFSTIYLGGDGSAFAAWGRFYGLAEGIDEGNDDLSDDAFVFSDAIDASGLAADGFGAALAEVVAHEAGHLLGSAHADGSGDAGPLAAVAFDPKVHVDIGKDAADDAVDDGKVTINGEEYVVHPLIVQALKEFRSYYNGGTVAGDAFPDLLMGQFQIHPNDHGTWITRVLDMAWQAQGDDSWSADEKTADPGMELWLRHPFRRGPLGAHAGQQLHRGRGPGLCRGRRIDPG